MSDSNRGFLPAGPKIYGVSMIELLIAIVIFAASSVPIISMFSSSKKTTYDLRKYTIGMTMAHNVMDELLVMSPAAITQKLYDNYDKKNLYDIISNSEYPEDYKNIIVRVEAEPVPNMDYAKLIRVFTAWDNSADGRVQEITLEGVCIDRRTRLYK